MMEVKIRTYDTLNKLVKFDKIPFYPECSKRCNLSQRKNNDDKISLEENTIPSHQDKAQVESSISFVQLVMPTASQKYSLNI